MAKLRPPSDALTHADQEASSADELAQPDRAPKPISRQKRKGATPQPAASKRPKTSADSGPTSTPDSTSHTPAASADSTPSNGVASRRVSQRKRASAQLNMAESDEDDEHVERDDPPTPPPARVSARDRKKQPLRGNWSAAHLLQNCNSKLKDVDLEKLLLHPKAWSSLNLDEQQKLVSMLPGAGLTQVPGGEEAVPNMPAQFIKSNPAFRSSMRLWQEELAAGHYDPKWLEDAANAMEKRAEGRFDDWKEKNMERFWGQKQRVTWEAPAGESAMHSLRDLVKGGCFQVGDVWLLQRGLKKAKIHVEKEATITAIADDYTLTFSYPPGQHKHSAPVNGEDKVLSGVTNPNPLALALCAEDGRIPPDHRAPNNWRDIRSFRKNQDMGALWDVRELYHQRQAATKSNGRKRS